mmetsp:Transcript_23342/g.31883  ORF Transcript_23342/g.31883 Transcript_23342/m.31883 type:complete len:202 (+) Transcript_23342:31-636(+)
MKHCAVRLDALFQNFITEQCTTTLINSEKSVGHKSLDCVEATLRKLYVDQGLVLPAFEPSFWVQKTQRNRALIPFYGASHIPTSSTTLYNDDDFYTLLAMQHTRDHLRESGHQHWAVCSLVARQQLPHTTSKNSQETTVSALKKKKTRVVEKTAKTKEMHRHSLKLLSRTSWEVNPKLVNFYPAPLTVSQTSTELLNSLFQ